MCAANALRHLFLQKARFWLLGLDVVILESNQREYHREYESPQYLGRIYFEAVIYKNCIVYMLFLQGACAL